MKKTDLKTVAVQGVVSFCDGIWILEYQNEFEERAEQKETKPERSMSFLDLKDPFPLLKIDEFQLLRGCCRKSRLP